MARERQTQREDEIRRLEAALAAMERTRRYRSRSGQLMADIFAAAGIGDWGGAPPHARSVALACRLCRGPESLGAFQQLIGHAEAHAGRLLHDATPDGLPSFILPLQQLAEYHPAWRRHPREWHPRKAAAAKQFADLLEHLFSPGHTARLPSAHFEIDPAARIRRFFGHLVQDFHRRPESPPALPLTKRMGYHFLLAPARYDLIRALRWAQVFGCGGSACVARAIDFTRLAWQLWEPREEAWWADVLHWLALHPELVSDEIAPILDYVHSQRYGAAELGQAPSPEFTLKGRTSCSVRRLVAEWHRGCAVTQATICTQFRPCGVRGGRWELETATGTCIWTIDEILDSVALCEEGRKLHHCVALYTRAITRGKCSIWSMKATRGDLVRHATTIQLDHVARRIIQCRGRCNRLARAEERHVLALWAGENELILAMRHSSMDRSHCIP